MRPLAMLLVLTAGLACAGDAAREADRPYTGGLAQVHSVAIRVDRSPIRAQVLVRGSLPDPCTELEPPRVRRAGSVFEVELTTRRRFGARCAAVAMPFERRIPLSLPGGSGAYFVTVNGVSQAFSVSPSLVGGPLLD